MERFLFNDGITGIKQIGSRMDLEAAINASPDPSLVRIWLYNSNAWLPLSEFRKQYPAIPAQLSTGAKPRTQYPSSLPPGVKRKSSTWPRTLVIGVVGVVIAFLVVNFTSLKWQPVSPIEVIAATPANVPTMDIDSLITEIEMTRNTPLDRSTRNNLRLRNTWPEKILLGVKSKRETKGSSSRLFDLDVTIDNTTGFTIDKAVAKLQVWQKQDLVLTDTIQFSNVRYNRSVTRQLDYRYKGDSISVSFESLRSRAFNFCYASGTPNSAGNYNDRWFCRE